MRTLWDAPAASGPPGVSTRTRSVSPSTEAQEFGITEGSSNGNSEVDSSPSRLLRLQLEELQGADHPAHILFQVLTEREEGRQERAVRRVDKDFTDPRTCDRLNFGGNIIETWTVSNQAMTTTEEVEDARRVTLPGGRPADIYHMDTSC